ncbi:MAG: type II toxin-antitoxin system Phd/YefM family antitoxin [Candidatus Omnitrophota bacterium]
MAVQSFINATEARKSFFELLEKVERGPYAINVTVKGIPRAVIMSKEEFDGWMATLETLSDPELMRSIRESEKDLRSGRYSSLEAVEKEIGLASSVSEKKSRYVSGKSSKLGKKRPKKSRP